jgi:chaperonin cofactor prefoldin
VERNDTSNDPKPSRAGPEEGEDLRVTNREFRYDLLVAQYKQQHAAALAENQALFGIQKAYVEKTLQRIQTQIGTREKQNEKVDHLSRSLNTIKIKIGELEATCKNIQNKLDSLKGDGDWVKFE